MFVPFRLIVTDLTSQQRVRDDVTTDGCCVTSSSVFNVTRCFLALLQWLYISVFLISEFLEMIFAVRREQVTVFLNISITLLEITHHLSFQ